MTLHSQIREHLDKYADEAAAHCQTATAGSPHYHVATDYMRAVASLRALFSVLSSAGVSAACGANAPLPPAADGQRLAGSHCTTLDGPTTLSPETHP